MVAVTASIEVSRCFCNNCTGTKQLTSLAIMSALYIAAACPLQSPPGANSVSALKASLSCISKLSITDRPQSDAPATTTCELTGVLLGASCQKANKANSACKVVGAACSLCLGAICLQHNIRHSQQAD